MAVLLKFLQLTKNRKTTYLLMSTMIIAITIMLGYSFYRSERVVHIYTSLMQASLEIQLQTTMAYFWLEKGIHENIPENTEKIWQHWNQANDYVKAMLQGIDNEENKYIPLKAEDIRQRIEKVNKHLLEFRDMAEKKLAISDNVGIDKNTARNADFIFKTVIILTTEVKNQLQYTMSQDIRRFHGIQIFLSLLIILFLWYLKTILLHYAEEMIQQLSDIQAQDANLQADIEKNKLVEQQLKEHQVQLEQTIERRTFELKLINSQLHCEIEQHEHTEEKLQKSEARYKAILECQTQLISRYNVNGQLTFVNEAYARYFGKRAEDLIGKKFSPLIPQENLGIVEQKLATLKPKNPMVSLEYPVILDDGKIRWQHCTNRVILDEDEKIVEYQSVAIDITERKRAEEELKKAHHALKILTKCRQILIRAKDENSLLHEICEMLVRDAGYVLVWIGFAEDNEHKTVRPVSQCGYENDYLASVIISWADNKFGQGPTGEAIRTGKPCFANDILTDPKFAPWRTQALKRGYASSMSIPLKIDEKTIGAINVYSQAANGYDKETIDLFQDLAADLMYTLSLLKNRELKKT